MEHHMVPSHTKGNDDIKVWTVQARRAPKKNKIAIFGLTHGGAALFGPGDDQHHEVCKSIKDWGRDDIMFILPNVRHALEIKS